MIRRGGGGEGFTRDARRLETGYGAFSLRDSSQARKRAFALASAPKKGATEVAPLDSGMCGQVVRAASSPSATQRNPMWVVDVSTGCG